MRCPFAVYRPVKRFNVPMVAPQRVNAHTAVTNAASLHGFMNTYGNPCSHFYIARLGLVEQYVLTTLRAAADLQGNPDTISIETWDGYPHGAPGYWKHNGDVPPWTPEQVESLIRLLTWLFETHPTLKINLAVDSVPGPSSTGVSYHRLGINPWRKRGGLLYSNARGKTCPGDRRRAQLPGIYAAVEANLSGKGSVTPKPIPPPTAGGPSVSTVFVSPVEGRGVSSPYGYRTHPITGVRNGAHRGVDLPAPRGSAVRAAYGGTVRFTRTNSFNGDRRGNALTGTWNTGKLVVVDGSGGGSELYGHLLKVKVKPGQRVKAGDIIGTVGRTGMATGYHVHFETWNGRNQGGGRFLGNTRDPMLDFRKYGVKPGQAFKRLSKPKPAKRNPGYSAANLRVQKRLAALGFYHGALDGVNGSYMRAGVKAWQRAQLYAPGLIADGVWGPASEAHYVWTRSLQRTMNRWKGPKVAIDGNYGPATRARVRNLQQRNAGGAYRGGIDSVPGPVFSRMLRIDPHPGR